MSESEPKPQPKIKGFLVALTRKEWEEEFKLGLTRPGSDQTYEDYIRGIAEDGWVACMPGDHKDYE